MPTPNLKTAAPPEEAAVVQSSSTTPESLGWQLRGALPPMRLHSVTLCDHEGDVLWLSEGALGPDEHGFVIEAISGLQEDTSLPHVEFDLQDGRYGVFLPVRSPQADLVALVMILAETKGLGTGVGTRVLTQQVRLILQKIAIHLRPQSAMAVVPPPASTVNAQVALNSGTPNSASTHSGNAHAAAQSVPSSDTVRINTKGSALNAAAHASASSARGVDASRATNAAHNPQAAAQRANAQPDFGAVTSILSPLAVDDILSFELVDDDSESAIEPIQEDPALALSPQSEELDDRFDIDELSLEGEQPVVVAAPRAPDTQSLVIEEMPEFDETQAFADTGKFPAPNFKAAELLNLDLPTPKADAPQKTAAAAPPAPAVLVPPMDIPVLSAAPVVARAAAPVEPPATTPEPAAQQPPPPLSETDVAIKALREPSNAYAAMRYGAIPVSKKPTPPPVAPRTSAPLPKLNSHVDPAFKDLALSVQLLSKLRPGGRTKRYEVLLRNKQDPKALHAAKEIIKALDENADLDGFVVSQLLTWLAENPQASEKEPLTFSINLSPRALHDERFPEFLSSWLRKTGIAAESIGFELSESVCVEHREAAERFVAACEKIGCFIVLDDFTMDSRAIEFLRSKALKLIKLDSRLTNEAMKDKLSQALVIGISQAAKVLGVHCAAKKIESQMVRRWITAIGFDFAQGTLFEGPQSVSDLLSS